MMEFIFLKLGLVKLTYAASSSPRLIAPFANTGTTIPDAPTYISNLYTFSIGMGALLALGVIVFGAIHYMTEVGQPFKQSEAKTWIFSGVTGLIILIAAVLILNTLNPKLSTITSPQGIANDITAKSKKERDKKIADAAAAAAQADADAKEKEEEAAQAAAEAKEIRDRIVGMHHEIDNVEFLGKKWNKTRNDVIVRSLILSNNYTDETSRKGVLLGMIGVKGTDLEGKIDTDGTQFNTTSYDQGVIGRYDSVTPQNFIDYAKEQGIDNWLTEELERRIASGELDPNL